MEKIIDNKFKSRWDLSTWLLLGVTAACCLVPCFADEDGVWPLVICLTILAFVVLVFAGIYYRIDGNNLLVYTFFRPRAYPIDKIKAIEPTNSLLSAPATSLTNRLAITFTDRSVLKSAIPLIVSPADADRFIASLLAVNPDIKLK